MYALNMQNLVYNALIHCWKPFTFHFSCLSEFSIKGKDHILVWFFVWLDFLFLFQF